MNEMNQLSNIVDTLSASYPHRHLQMKHEYGNTYLYADGEAKFCATGYNLLFNMKRLCDVLEDELL